MATTLTSGVTVVQTAKFTFNKANGGSKTLSVPSPKDVSEQSKSDIEGLADVMETHATIGGGLKTKTYTVDKTQRTTFKPQA